MSSLHLLSLLAVSCSFSQQMSGQGDLYVRTFDASCQEICDGSAEILNFRVSPDRNYYWRSVDERGYRILEDTDLSGLCRGTYLLRQVDISYDELEIESTSDTDDNDYDLIGEFSFSSSEKRDLTLYFDLNRDVAHPNYHTRSSYSLDHGVTWKTSSQINRKLVTDISGQGRNKYLLNLPKSASNSKEVKVRIYERKPEAEKAETHIPIKIISSHLESKVTTEVEFKVNAQQAMNIKSTISNEVDGGDGYIFLDILGGNPPYVVLWEDGDQQQRRKRLAAGSYTVDVSDRKDCHQGAEFSILSPSHNGIAQDFRLTALQTSGLFRLEIDGIYRQPMDLVIEDRGQHEVKRFKINPLYQDLVMELDLSFLEKGPYNATLSTSGFSKKSQISID